MCGIASHRDLLRYVSRWQIRAAVSGGDIARISRDRYCAVVVVGALGQARRSQAYLTHLSAALHHGWAVRFPPDDAQLKKSVPYADRDGWATTVLRALSDCCHDLPFADALAVCDSALRARSIEYDELLRASRGWKADARRVAAYADGKAKNPFESSLRAIAIQAGLGVAAQWQVDAGSLRFHPDVADPIRGLALEADSYAWHGATRELHEQDCERYNLMVLAGWRVLRFTWGQVMLDPRAVTQALAAATRSPSEEATRRPLGASAA